MIRCSLVKPQKTHADTCLLIYLTQQPQVITEKNIWHCRIEIVFDQIPYVVCWLGCYWILVKSCPTGTPLLLLLHPANLSHKILYRNRTIWKLDWRVYFFIVILDFKCHLFISLTCHCCSIMVSSKRDTAKIVQKPKNELTMREGISKLENGVWTRKYILN